MQCQICHAELPPTVTLCPHCGTQNSLPNQGIAPTVLASSPDAAYPTPPPAQQSYTPYPTTSYGGSAPPPPPPVTPYPAYPTPSAPYGAPPMYAQPQPPKSNRGCITAIVVTVVLLLIVIGGSIATIAIAYNAGHNALSTINAQATAAQATFTSDLTAVPTSGNTNSNVPDPSQIDSNAATMVLSAQSSSGIDNNDKPIDSQTTFTAGTSVYVTFTTAGNTGYVMSKWFLNGQDDVDSQPIADTNGQTEGYFSHAFANSGSAVIGIYWCTQANCSDAALAQIVNVTIS